MNTENIDIEKRKTLKVLKQSWKVPVFIALGSLIPAYVEGGSCAHPNTAGYCPPGQNPEDTEGVSAEELEGVRLW